GRAPPPCRNFATISQCIASLPSQPSLMSRHTSSRTTSLGADQDIKIHYEPGEAPGLPGRTVVRRAKEARPGTGICETNGLDLGGPNAVLWHIALSNRRSRKDDDHGRQQDDGANVKQGWLHRRARPERRIDPGGAAPLRHSRQRLWRRGADVQAHARI